MFSTQLFEIEQHVYAPAESPTTGNNSKETTNINNQEISSPHHSGLHDNRMNTESAISIYTLLIGNATGKQIQTRTRTNGATLAPMTKPYREQTDCGMICSQEYNNINASTTTPTSKILY